MSEEDKGQWFEIPDRKIEYVKPDLSLAYVELAPLVAEAWAYTVSGNTTEAHKTLRLARQVIDTVSMRMVVVKDDSKPPEPSPNTMSY